MSEFPTMTAAVAAPRAEFDSAAGRLSYYVDGPDADTATPPLLLIHSINASGSAYEIKPIFEHYRATRRVYAPDLPGFGFSERGDRRYNVALYTQSIRAMLERIGSDWPNLQVDALALSLSSEFLARVALDADSPLARIALVTPTGFRRGSDRMREPQGNTREMRWLYRTLRFGLWRRPLFNALTSPKSIRYFLKRTWGSDNPDQGLAAYDDIMTAQPGAEYAPLAFLGGGLFSTDIRTVYESLTLPVWLGHGTRGDFKDFSEAAWTRERANWTRTAFESGALPHFECPTRFFSELDAFFQRQV